MPPIYTVTRCHNCYHLMFDEIQMWHDHRDLYMNKLEDILITPDDSDIGYFVEIDLRYLII